MGNSERKLNISEVKMQSSIAEKYMDKKWQENFTQLHVVIIISFPGE